MMGMNNTSQNLHKRCHITYDAWVGVATFYMLVYSKACHLLHNPRCRNNNYEKSLNELNARQK